MKIDFCIFFVTSKCNSNCRLCFYKDKLNRDDDLTFREIKEISAQMGNFSTLLFSGGEPFLNKELAEIVDTFITQNRVKVISIPTNGIDSELIYSTIETILNRNRGKQVKFFVNVSVDALGRLNDDLRGRDGAFASAMDTLKKLSGLKGRFQKFSLSVNSVFSAQSAEKTIALIAEIAGFDFIDFHDLEIIRPREPGGYAHSNIDVRLLKQAHLFLAQVNAEKLKQKLREAKNIIYWFLCLRRLIGSIGYLRLTQSIKEKFLQGGENLFRCPAGRSICVIDANADVRLCELGVPVGNLRRDRYDLYAVLNSPLAAAARKKVTDSRCNCTHVCFISEYLNQGLGRRSPKIILQIIFYFFIFLLRSDKHAYLKSKES